ncbi:hypothetical protein [uncultured Algibacter sp.]|uniref:hypothetical protein n=1 Tax=uncultured Algibacter sp. TaxID=298659 RepID=UPI002616904C|nr:hypothetical protein [uncultured Algibacter sp.]
MKFNKFLLFILCATFFACSTESSNDKDDDEETTDNTLLKKIVYNKGTIDEYSETFSYDGNKLVSVDYGGGSFTDYLYENGNLVRVNSTIDGVVDAYTIITYNEDDKIGSYILHIIDNNTFRYEFTHNSNNTIKLDAYIGDLNSQTTLSRTNLISYDGKNIISQVNDDDDDYELIFEYDNKNGVFKNVEQMEVINLVSIDFGGLEGFTENIKERTDNDFVDIYKETYDYTYNENGYPITAIYKDFYDGELEEETLIEYIYE